MATEKIVNYTEAQVTEMVSAYTASPTEATVKALAEKLGKTTKSIVAKLVREKVYVSKAKEAGKRAATKAELVAQIADKVGTSEEVLESLEKATAGALTKVLEALRSDAQYIDTLHLRIAELESAEVAPESTGA